MRFFRKLLSLVSNSAEKNDYARATLEYATCYKRNKSHALDCRNQGFVFDDNTAYHQAILNYATEYETKTKNSPTIIDTGLFNLPGRRISVTFYRSFTSKTSRSISYY